MTSPRLALIVDDEPDIRELIDLTLTRMGLECRLAADLTEARQLLTGNSFDLCLTDMRLPDGNGIELVREIQAHRPDLPVAVITAHGTMDSAIDALKSGAFDFVTKPVELRVLRELVESALKLAPATVQTGESEAHRLLGESAVIRTIRATIAKLARSQAPVYISGESGTGKELVARLIHEQGPRAEHPFVPVNCGAVPPELMESEFFGHKRGSFTGATTDKPGLFQAADGGTLFLDEVADLPLAMQVKLLRAIQEKTIRPVGATSELHVDVRILSATHKDLKQLVAAAEFREDLFYRLNVIELKVPPLRARREDIAPLVAHILRRLAVEMELCSPELAPDALEAIERHPLPGNVRELENILERALTLCEGSLIRVEDLHLPTAPDDDRLAPATAGLEPYLEQLEREAIVGALEQSAHNKTAAARLLGISFRALRYRLKKLGLE